MILVIITKISFISSSCLLVLVLTAILQSTNKHQYTAGQTIYSQSQREDERVHIQKFQEERQRRDDGMPDNEWSWDRNYYPSRPVPGIGSVSSSMGINGIGPPATTTDGPTNTTDGGNNGETIRSLLVVQVSGFGAEVEILDVTSKVNRAYAKRWTFDFLKFTGIALGSQPWQSTFNKAFLLRYLVEKKIKNSDFQVYDNVLMLDADSMIVNLDYNVLDLIPADKLLSDGIGASLEIKDEYSDVMLWNLNHPDVGKVSDIWLDRSMGSLAVRNVNGQKVLLDVLDAEYDDPDSGDDRIPQVVNRIPEPFVDGLQGTIIKQDVENKKHGVIESSDLPKILPTVQGIADSVCYRYYPQCEVV